MADRLVDAGVTSILNFAPALISVPEGISVRKVDLAVELQILSFYQQHRAGRSPTVPGDGAVTDRPERADRGERRYRHERRAAVRD